MTSCAVLGRQHALQICNSCPLGRLQLPASRRWLNERLRHQPGTRTLPAFRLHEDRARSSCNTVKPEPLGGLYCLLQQQLSCYKMACKAHPFLLKLPSKERLSVTVSAQAVLTGCVPTCEASLERADQAGANAAVIRKIPNRRHTLRRVFQQGLPTHLMK